MVFRFLSRRNRAPASAVRKGRGGSGFFSLQDAPGQAWDDPDDRFDDWDVRLDSDSRAGELERYSKRSKWWWAKRISVSLLAVFILLLAWLAITAPLSKSLQPIAPPQLTLLAADGTPIARNGAIVDQPVDAAKLPPQVIHAFLAIEDRRFYSHWGIDPRGIARAAISGTGGGSTITQQLAKFTFLTPERSLTRKAREMLIAFWLEAWLTKDQILSRYLSNAYFGDNVYGLRAASLHYFYRQPEKLRPEQAAMLAGLVQAPSRFAPTQHFDRAAKRMKMVINAMVAAGYLTPAQAKAMPTPRLDVRARAELPTGTYFADWALPDARKLVGTGYSRQTLTTTLDARLQNIARRVVSQAGLGRAQVALVAMRPNGEVVAMIGGKDYAQSPFNRATQARRQPGSTFKLFVYLAAMEDGMKPSDLIDNTAITSGSYQPQNASGHYSSTITLEDAFARSSNVAAVRLMQKVGDRKVIGTARKLGVTAPLAEGDPSLALGTSSMTLMELTAAYAGVAANSFPVRPHAIPQDKSSWLVWAGDRIRAWTSGLSYSEHANMEDLLRSVVTRGTGRAAGLSMPSYGKTGTSQDNRDALFVGYAGGLVVGVWIGNDDNSPLRGIHGGGLPARIWHDFMVQAQRQGSGQSRPAALPTVDPDGPVQPLDEPDMGPIPLGDSGAQLQIHPNEGVTLTTDVKGMPVEIRLNQDGVSVTPSPPAPVKPEQTLPQPPG